MLHLFNKSILLLTCLLFIVASCEKPNHTIELSDTTDPSINSSLNVSEQTIQPPTPDPDPDPDPEPIPTPDPDPIPDPTPEPEPNPDPITKDKDAFIIPTEDNFYTIYAWAVDDEDYPVDENTTVHWRFGDGTPDEEIQGDLLESHQYPNVPNAKYTLSIWFERDGLTYVGSTIIAFDNEGHLLDSETPDLPDFPDTPDPPTIYYKKIAENGDNPLITSTFSNINETIKDKLYIFVKFTGTSPKDQYQHGVFYRRAQAAPKDIYINEKEHILAEQIALKYNLNSLGKFGSSPYSKGQGFGYDDGAKFDIPFYYSSDWMTIPTTGGTLNLGEIVIWDLDSKGIFGTSDFEHEVWIRKQKASISITKTDLNAYEPSKHYPFVLVTIEVVCESTSKYTWHQREVKFLERSK